MKSYDCRNPVKCQEFHDAGSYEELLKAIAKWWKGVEEEVPTLEVIAFRIDDDLTHNASVFWCHD